MFDADLRIEPPLFGYRDINMLFKTLKNRLAVSKPADFSGNRPFLLIATVLSKHAIEGDF